MTFLKNVKIRDKLILILMIPLLGLIHFGSSAVLESYRYQKDMEVLSNIVKTAASDEVMQQKLQYKINDTAQDLKKRAVFHAAIGSLVLLLSIFFIYYLSRSINRPLKKLQTDAKDIMQGKTNLQIQSGDGDEIGDLSYALGKMLESFKSVINQANRVASEHYDTQITPRSSHDELSHALNSMTKKLAKISKQNQREKWLKTGKAELLTSMRGIQTVHHLCEDVLGFLAQYIDAQLAKIYLVDEEGYFNTAASYAVTGNGAEKKIALGEGVVGQVARDQNIICLNHIPEGYLKLSTGLGECNPTHILVVPLVMEGKTKAVVEFAALHGFPPQIIEFIEMVTESMAIAINTAQDRENINSLFEQTKKQSEQLQKQQENLQIMNKELRLKSKELEQVSRYKSEFLANMSHELRTPLNSILILAEMMVTNSPENLTQDQEKGAQVILSSGNDLLELINDILDLSKVEAGKLKVVIKTTEISAIAKRIRDQFVPIAKHKGLGFSVKIASGLPKTIDTDHKRIEQVIKNLLSNAFKFTKEGSVKLEFCKPDPEIQYQHEEMDAQSTLAIRVSDTGIGIAKEKQEKIFEAFHQVDGSTNRNYGGTGLGLAISREMSGLLKGEVKMQSEEGAGSKFTLYVPIHQPKTSGAVATKPHSYQDAIDGISGAAKDLHVRMKTASEVSAEVVAHDQLSVEGADKKIILLDDDVRGAFALNHFLKGQGFSVILANDGLLGLQKLFHEEDVDLVITDISMPELNGVEVIKSIRSHEKHKNIPIIAITADTTEECRERCLEAGANEFLAKPINLEVLLTTLSRYLTNEKHIESKNPSGR
jgi:signal transduction histidine kinase/ActR/RegA family two-component response regulator/HAMP domain-containing protein